MKHSVPRILPLFVPNCLITSFASSIAYCWPHAPRSVGEQTGYESAYGLASTHRFQEGHSLSGHFEVIKLQFKLISGYQFNQAHGLVQISLRRNLYSRIRYLSMGTTGVSPIGRDGLHLAFEKRPTPGIRAIDHQLRVKVIGFEGRVKAPEETPFRESHLSHL